jgi:hypothetical protein
MVTFKSFNNIVLDIINGLRLAQPSLDIKPNSVARDLFIDAQALQISNIYEVLQQISALQSIANITGQDLTNYGSNYGLSRQTGTKSIGTAVFTFKELDNDVTIDQGSVVRTRNGLPFLTVSTTTVKTTQANALRATATRLREQLDTAGITDEFAIEVSVEAQSTGSAGNIATYSIINHSIANVSNVTNLAPCTGGTDLESDAAFRSRILATFAGANVGTAIGYRSTVLNLADAIDALVIEPGDTLMVRDGTVVVEDAYGNTIVSEPGTGGRVDIYVMGENAQSGTDSFVYYDQSGTGDPADSDNDFILGQSSLTTSTNLTLNSRRVATLSGTDAIPNQPVSKLVSVSGSSSGPNFVEQYLDDADNYQGNYKLVKDAGYAGGSPFGLDKFVWTSGQVELEGESTTKGPFNSIDGLSFTDVLIIPGIEQEMQVINENSTVASQRKYVTTNHTPIKTVSRVFNLTTGERYTIKDQNPDGDGTTNTTGRVEISGRTLPTASDVLQVDYTWVFSYDPYVDYDNFNPADILNSAQDSVEWGFSNYIRDEISQANLDAYNNLTVRTEYPISRVLSVNTFLSETTTVKSDGTIEVSTAVSNVHSIKDNSLTGSPEVYNTLADDGTFSNKVVTLPTDTLAQTGDLVTVVYNLTDISGTGQFVNNEITILPATAVASGTIVRANYVADLSNVIPANTQLSDLPISGDGFNAFVSVDGYQPFLNVYTGSVVDTNQRRSPSNLVVTTSNIPTTGGSLRMSGTTINKVSGILTVTSSGTSIDFSSLIREAEGLGSTASISSYISVSRVAKLEKVTLNISGEISTVDHTYDLTNYKIKDSKWDRAFAVELSTLSRTSMQLAPTTINTQSAAAITTGTRLNVEFYYAKENDHEDLYFSRSGKAITDKRFGYVSSISRLSGMQDSGGTVSGAMQIDTLNQPTENESYLVDYNYTAPKENERITINYEFNKLIVDATEAVEEKRPITADVLVKAAAKIECDVTAVIIVEPAYKDKESTVKQDVADNITSTLTATSLGTILDSSDIVDNVYNVEGVDRVRITRFNRANVAGTKLSITAEKSEYIAPGTVTVTTEDR